MPRIAQRKNNFKKKYPSSFWEVLTNQLHLGKARVNGLIDGDDNFSLRELPGGLTDSESDNTALANSVLFTEVSPMHI